MCRKIWSLILHLVPVGTILVAWSFIARWYYYHLPALGIDLYNTVTYSSYLSKYFTPRVSGWKYIWWTGHPLEGDYPLLHAYLISPLIRFLGAVPGVQIYMLVVLLLFLFFSYLLFWEVSKSRAFSGLLTLATTFSVAIYGALVWGGSLPYFATQAFLPLSLYLLTKYLVNRNRSYLYLSATVTGVSVLGHPQIPIVYIFPSVFLLLMLWFDKRAPFLSRRKVKDFLLFSGIATLVGYVELYFRTGANIIFFPLWLVSYLFSFVSLSLSAASSGQQVGETGGGMSPTQVNMQRVDRSRLQLFAKETHVALFAAFSSLLAAVILFSVFSRKRKRFLRVLPFAALVGYHVFYVILFSLGFSFFHGGWYRVFWPFPIFLGVATAWLWRLSGECVLELLPRILSKTVRLLVLPALVLAGSIVMLTNRSGFFEKLDDPQVAYSETSSAYPMPLNYLVKQDDQELLKRTLVPEWLDVSDKEHRLYTADAQVNIWWNSLFDMPLLRGYTDPPIGTERRGGFFWLDVALTSNQLVNIFGVPERVAYQNALFLLDWFGIRYLETGHASASYSPLSSYLKDADIFAREEELWFADRDLLYKYYLGRERPPLQPVNLPVIYFVGNQDSYLATVEALSLDPDLPRLLIIKGPDFLDSVTGEELKSYDGLILYNYGYSDASLREEAYDSIVKFVAAGRPIWIETGGGGFESNTLEFVPKEKLAPYSRNLPQLFPILLSQRGELGNVWELDVTDEVLREGVDFDDFAPTVDLILGGEGEGRTESGNWEFSYPPFNTSVEQGAAVLVSNHSRPVVVKKQFGQGTVVWSGMNLPQHAKKHNNSAEKAFFSNLVFHLFDFPKAGVPPFEVSSSMPGQLTVRVEGSAKGLFFSREDLEGWSASLGGKQDIPIQVMSFADGIKGMLIPLSTFTEHMEGAFEVDLTYTGRQLLHYFELKEEYVSPILHPTNTAVIAVVGNDATYESFFRVLGMNNMNSKKVIPLKITEALDNLSPSELANFDALFLYGYTYSNHGRVWKMLDDWVREGGKLFIETGSQVKETSTLTNRYPVDELPSLFPMTATRKKALGRNWQWTARDEGVLTGVDLESFSPPTLDGKPWMFSLPADEFSLREGVIVILRYGSEPILVRRDYGRGRVIWSGMNLPYHATVYNNSDEGFLMVNLIKELLTLGEQRVLPDYSVSRQSSQDVTIDSGPARGVLFREQAYSGWRAYLSSDNKRGRLKVYKAGPTFHGFIYVPIPKEVQGSPFRVHFHFGGRFSGYFHSFLSLMTVLLVIDKIIFKGRVLGLPFLRVVAVMTSRVKDWWGGEEDY